MRSVVTRVPGRSAQYGANTPMAPRRCDPRRWPGGRRRDRYGWSRSPTPAGSRSAPTCRRPTPRQGPARSLRRQRLRPVGPKPDRQPGPRRGPPRGPTSPRGRQGRLPPWRVSDLTRQDALRFRVDDGPFLAADSHVPTLIELPKLLRAADGISTGDGDDTLAAVKVLLDAGTSSLGGDRQCPSLR